MRTSSAEIIKRKKTSKNVRDLYVVMAYGGTVATNLVQHIKSKMTVNAFGDLSNCMQ